MSRRRRLAIPGPLVVLTALLLATATAGSVNAESASITASVQVASVVVSVSLTVSSGSIRIGDTAKAVATVANVGTARATKVLVSLRVDAAGLRVKGSDPVTITRLQPGRSKSVTWSVCGLQPGTYVLLARAIVDGGSVDSPAVLVSVIGQRKKTC
ncbi:MAG: hypothetical protein HYX55_00675 [Chloroflexi bacterium]|nr:hypothetical protein [Chloroflexota bacterium]